MPDRTKENDRPSIAGTGFLAQRDYWRAGKLSFTFQMLLAGPAIDVGLIKPRTIRMVWQSTSCISMGSSLRLFELAANGQRALFIAK
ncbi:hypothetical protein ACN47E_000373 [Coniothyrium glycines]